MASSGTVADPTIHFRYRPTEGPDGILIGGYGRMKSQAVVEAADLSLRTIKNFVAIPNYVRDPVGGTYFGETTVLYGSINTPGSLMNSITLTALKGSHRHVTGGDGTSHLGTARAGTIQASFMVIGA